MDSSNLPQEWQDALRRDVQGPPPFVDPGPERRLARLLAAFVVSGLVFMIGPGTLLGVWNLLGISSHRQAEGVSAAWIQAHGHAQFFGWVGTFIIGISLYTIPKFRRSRCCSIPIGWAMWTMWSAGVALRWFGSVQHEVHRAVFVVSAALELAVSALLIWQCFTRGVKHQNAQSWEAPIFAGFMALSLILAWQLFLAAQPLSLPALPLAQNRILISLAIWTFSFPVVLGYSAKFFPGLLGTAPAHGRGIRFTLLLLLVAALFYVVDSVVLASAITASAVVVACWSLRVFHPTVGRVKTGGVDPRYPAFARLAYVWVAISAVLSCGIPRPGMMGASRHAFTVGFLATLIFSIGPRILPSFLNSRELWSARLMRLSLVLITVGCALRVISEPLAYGGTFTLAWKALPASALAELAAIVLFGVNVMMSLATPIPCWFRRAQVNDAMSVYWLISSYPATRKLLVKKGLATLGRIRSVPRSLSLRDAARADGISPEILVEELGAFFDSRLARSLRAQPRNTSESVQAENSRA